MKTEMGGNRLSIHLEKFRSAVCGYLENNGIIVDRSDISDDVVIQAQGKIVQLRLVEDATMLVSTIVYFNMMGEEDVDNTLISEFNACQLFKGGYRLMIEPQSKSIYIEQGLNSGKYDAENLSSKLYDFVKRSIVCTRSYIEKTKENNDNTNSLSINNI